MVKPLVFKYLSHSPKDDEDFGFDFARVHVILESLYNNCTRYTDLTQLM